MKAIEFVYFYLMPEVPTQKVTTSATNTAILGGRGREIIAAFDRRRETINATEMKVTANTRTTEDKQGILSKYLGNVHDLVEDLKEDGIPFQLSS